MKKTILFIMAILFTGVFLGCDGQENDKLKVAVTIVPQAAFVDAVGGDLVEVITIIPVGFSPASYEPSAKEIVNLNKASVYFTLGVPAESGNIIPEVDDIPLVRLEDKVREVYDDLYFDYEHTHDEEDTDHEENTDHEEETHSEFSRDPHIWLSVKRVKVMVQVIADELSIIDPANAETYQENASVYLGKLDKLDNDIQTLFDGKTIRTFIVYHPSYGYFSDDYDLEMLALEEDGKDPSIAHLQELIDFARANGINRIYHQAEIDSERVTTFKNDIDGISVKLYPLDYDYIETMLDLATKIAEGLS